MTATARDRKPTLVLLVRHGRTGTTGRILPGRAPGLHLDSAGRLEAAAAAERIGRLKRVAAVYSSPLERARETAAPIAEACGIEPRIEPGLDECEYGGWTGARLARLRRSPDWAVVQRHPSGFRFPGGESFTEMQTRVTGTLARLVAAHPGATIVAVSHADPIKAAVAHALGIHLDLFQRIVISTGAVTAIACHRSAPAVLTVNSLGGELAGLEAP
jgi:probable phosphoglycerate mutase